RLVAAPAGELGSRAVFPLLFPGNDCIRLRGIQLRRAVAQDERALLGQPQRPDRLAVQMAHRRRRRPHGRSGDRRGVPLRDLPSHRRMAQAPSRRRRARKGDHGRGREEERGRACTRRRGRAAQGGYLMFGLSNPELGVLMLALFVVFIMFGFPIAFTLMALGVFFGYFAMGDLIFQLLVQRSYSVMTNDVLISIPLFVFMGYIVERANILDRLFRSLQLAAGPIPASLALATLATCAIFATATGIVGACVTLMGLLAFPAMLRAGYDVKIASGVVCAGGCLGILIPPSVMLILYGATAGVSVVKLYAGAFFPGIMLAGLYMLYVIIMTLLNPKLAPQLPAEERNVPLTTVLWALLTSFAPLAGLIGPALGSILFGLATPSEAAAMGSLGALLLAAGYGADYKRRRNVILVQIYGVLAAAFFVYLIVCGVTHLDVDRRVVTV